jgi:hypothetical protein
VEHRVPGDRDKLIVALAAVHALTMTQIRRLWLEDLDRARGQLRVRRPDRLDHVACLDELTLGLVTTGITERVERWPDSANPYLMVSRQTAVDDLHPHVSQDVIRTPFQRAGHQAGQAPAGPALRRGPGNRRPCPSHGVFGVCGATATR